MLFRINKSKEEFNKLYIEEDRNFNLPDIELLKQEFINKNINGLIVSIDYKKDKSFLSDFKDIKFLSISPITNKDDINLIYEFKELTHLRLRELLISKSFQKKYYPEKEKHEDLNIDFSNFKNLRDLVISCNFNNKNIKNINVCNSLDALHISEYREKDVELFSGLENLKELRIDNSSIKSLKGIEKLENLEYLSLRLLLSLRDLSHISKLKNLKQLTIDTCSKIYDYDALSGLENLEEILIPNNRDIKDLKFLSHLKKLRLFKMGESSNVVDGDLSYTDNIKEAYFPSRKHYNR